MGKWDFGFPVLHFLLLGIWLYVHWYMEFWFTCFSLLSLGYVAHGILFFSSLGFGFLFFISQFHCIFMGIWAFGFPVLHFFHLGVWAKGILFFPSQFDCFYMGIWELEFPVFHFFPGYGLLGFGFLFFTSQFHSLHLDEYMGFCLSCSSLLSYGYMITLTWVYGL